MCERQKSKDELVKRINECKEEKRKKMETEAWALLLKESPGRLLGRWTFVYKSIVKKDKEKKRMRIKGES